MTQQDATPAPIFTGTAGRRTFSRELDDGRFVVYSISVGNQRQERFCSRAEWDDWCEQHAPPVAVPGLFVAGATRTAAVLRILEAGTLEVSVTETRIMSQYQADRLVRRLAAESKRSGPPAATDDDDGA